MSNALGMERKKELVGASDRSFGLMFAVVFALATGLIQLRFESLTSRVAPILLLLGSLSLTIALIRPRLLRPLNRGWMTFSLLLGRITSPIVLAVLYYTLISPLAVTLRLRGRDVLRLRSASDESHWRTRSMRGYDLSQFRNQY